MTSPEALAESGSRAWADAVGGPVELPDRDIPTSVGNAPPSRRGEDENGVPGAEGCELPAPDEGMTRQGEPPLSANLVAGAGGAGAGCE